MSENQLKLRSINELIEAQDNFYIPAYQRGYRWTTRQVEELLGDILEFHNKEKKQSEFYCLQPVVVLRSNERWDLIDGQQRLTTLFIILSYFNRRLAEEFRKPLFSLEYATRQKSKDFLLNINAADKDSNIDFYHMHQAYEVIQHWFKTRQNLINDLESIFLNRVKVIWYEIKEQIDPIEVFTRLNIGKIPLTNAELVKALFLRAGNFGENQTRLNLRRMQIAQEWDDMERALQHDDFWYFLTNKDEYSTRIEFILSLVADEIGTADEVKKDPHYIFIAFNRWFEKTDNSAPMNIDARWEYVRKYFLTLDEWFQDRYWFHVIGFLINQGVPIREIRKQSETTSGKPVFRTNLKRRIFNFIFFNSPELTSFEETELEAYIKEQTTDWEYGNGSRAIRPALLLFNLASMLRNSESNLRFQFDSYKKDNWDLEHIRSVKSNMPLRPDDQKRWLENIINYFSNNHEAEAIESNQQVTNELSQQQLYNAAQDALRVTPFNSEEFSELYESLLSVFGESDEGETDNSIANLALLDASTNRSYGNEVFPIKRKRIIELDKKGSFVPLCTKNVFLKYYSDKVDNMMFWGARDSEDYLNAINEVLFWFFSAQSEEAL